MKAINNAKAKILRIQPFVVEYICPRRFKGMAGVIKLDPTSYPKLDRNDNLIPHLLRRTHTRMVSDEDISPFHCSVTSAQDTIEHG